MPRGRLVNRRFVATESRIDRGRRDDGGACDAVRADDAGAAATAATTATDVGRGLRGGSRQRVSDRSDTAVAAHRRRVHPAGAENECAPGFHAVCGELCGGTATLASATAVREQ